MSLCRRHSAPTAAPRQPRRPPRRLPAWTRGGGGAAAALLLAAVSPRGARAVLRFPDAGHELRWPVTLEDCDGAIAEGGGAGRPEGTHLRCLEQLREHVREDLNCTTITSDNEGHVTEADLILIYRSCDNFRLGFECAFAAGLRPAADADEADEGFRQDWLDFVGMQLEVFERPPPSATPAFANSTAAIIRRHSDAVVRRVAEVYEAPDWRTLLRVAMEVAARMQLLIENLSMSLLVNFLLGNLEFNSLADGRDYVRELYGDIAGRYEFHDGLGPKRWNVLFHLLERLAGAGGGGGAPADGGGGGGGGGGAAGRAAGEGRLLRMVEVGVDTANVSLRLLERYPASLLALHVGVDPYRNKPGSIAGDETYEDTRARLEPFGVRSRLLRMTSEEAAAALDQEEPFDLVYLDARHDREAVEADIQAWWPRVRRPGGILAGHDFQWQYLGLPMAVSSALRWLPVRPSPGNVQLASDGMWWFDL